MKSLFIITLSIVSFTIPVSGFSQTTPTDSLTLNESIQKAIQTNPDILQAAHSIDVFQSGVEVNKSSYYPNANADLTYARLGPASSVVFPIPGIPPQNFQLYPLNAWDEHLVAEGIIYDFNKRSRSVDLAASQVNTAQDRLELAKSGLSYRTIQTFYAILFLEKSIRVQDEEIKNLNDHLLMTQKKVQAGTATDFDALTTQVRVAAAQNEKINLQNNLENTKVVFRRLLGLAPDSPVNLSGEFAEEPVPLNTDSLVSQALSGRIEMKVADDQLNSAQMQYKVASATNNPTLGASLMWGLKNGLFPDQTALRGNFVAGIQLAVPLFDGFRERNLEEEANASIRVYEDNRSGVAEQVKSDVQKGISDVQSSLDRLRMTDITVEQAKSAVEQARIRYDAGTITNLDLLDAETSLSQAELMQIQALYRFVVSRYELDQAIGQKVW
ncbi:MAG TPA: TolC family protein [Candidatus Acidoferrales bacterium]|nr:TolC family protein [Candidatus Acidoferrales bacterium]